MGLIVKKLFPPLSQRAGEGSGFQKAEGGRNADQVALRNLDQLQERTAREEITSPSDLLLRHPTSQPRGPRDKDTINVVYKGQSPGAESKLEEEGGTIGPMKDI